MTNSDNSSSSGCESNDGSTPPCTPQRIPNDKQATIVPVENNSNRIVLDELVRGRTGGIYIPPFKLAQMKKDKVDDKGSKEYQKLTWDALRKSINGLINKVNVSNVQHIIPELFQENILRGRGLFARAVMKAQLASPGFTHIYAALVAVVNSKMPMVGELLLKRVILQFRRAKKRNNKVVAIALVRFIAHLVNQQVVHELLALQLLTVLLDVPTNDSVELAVNFTKECGNMLGELCPQGLHAVFERFRGILHEGEVIDKRVQFTIEGLFAIRKGGFADYPAIHPELDLIEATDQMTHDTGLEDEIEKQDILDVFREDPNYLENERMWESIKKSFLGEDSSSSGSSGEESGSDTSEEEGKQEETTGNTVIQDFSEQDVINLRRTIYLTIMSSISHEECAHKLMKLNIRIGQEKEICSMLIECCSQERTYLRYYGLLAQRFCMIKREYQDALDQLFEEQYGSIHRLETNKLRNVAKFFAHLLYTDALPWTCFEVIKLNEDDTTSSSRIFIKILCQELSEQMGLAKFKERLFDEYMTTVFSGLLPKDNPRDTRFSINFFTSIGLGALTDNLREHLKSAPKALRAAPHQDSDSSSGSSSSSSSSGSSSSSSSDSSSSDSEDSTLSRNRDKRSSIENRSRSNSPKYSSKPRFRDTPSPKYLPDNRRERVQSPRQGRNRYDARRSSDRRSPRRSRDRRSPRRSRDRHSPRQRGNDRASRQSRDRRNDKERSPRRSRNHPIKDSHSPRRTNGKSISRRSPARSSTSGSPKRFSGRSNGRNSPKREHEKSNRRGTSRSRSGHRRGSSRSKSHSSDRRTTRGRKSRWARRADRSNSHRRQSPNERHRKERQVSSRSSSPKRRRRGSRSQSD